MNRNTPRRYRFERFGCLPEIHTVGTRNAGMPTWTGVWSAAEAEAYLTERTVPIRIACRMAAGGLWMLSLWYLYDEKKEEFYCATNADADVVKYLDTNPEVAFEVSDDKPPYRGVRGAGTATIKRDGGKELLEELFVRYLGGTDNRLADRLLVDDREEVRIEIKPTKLYTWDFTEQMADAVTDES